MSRNELRLDRPAGLLVSSNRIKLVSDEGIRCYSKSYKDQINGMVDYSAYLALERLYSAVVKAEHEDFSDLQLAFPRTNMQSLAPEDKRYLTGLIPKIRVPHMQDYNVDSNISMINEVWGTTLLDALEGDDIKGSAKNSILEILTRRLAWSHHFFPLISEQVASIPGDVHKNIIDFRNYFGASQQIGREEQEEINRFGKTLESSVSVCKNDLALNHILLHAKLDKIIETTSGCHDPYLPWLNTLDRYVFEIDKDKICMRIPASEDFAQTFGYSCVNLDETSMKRYYSMVHVWDKIYTHVFDWISEPHKAKELKKANIEQGLAEIDIVRRLSDDKVNAYFSKNMPGEYNTMVLGIAMRAMRSAVNRIERNYALTLQHLAALESGRTDATPYKVEELREEQVRIDRFVFGDEGYLAQAENYLVKAGMHNLAAVARVARKNRLENIIMMHKHELYTPRFVDSE